MKETRLGHRWVVFGRTRRALLRCALATVPLSMIGSIYWQFDVAPEQRRLAATTPEVNQVLDAANPDAASTAVVDLVGLGNVDAASTARELTSFADIGRVWSVRYDNRGIDTEVSAA